MTEQPREHFLDTLANLQPGDQAIMLANALGAVVRASTEDHVAARDAVDELFKVTEKAAGLRL